jgi:hypothetical protein
MLASYFRSARTAVSRASWRSGRTRHTNQVRGAGGPSCKLRSGRRRTNTARSSLGWRRSALPECFREQLAVAAQRLRPLPCGRRKRGVTTARLKDEGSREDIPILRLARLRSHGVAAPRSPRATARSAARAPASIARRRHCNLLRFGESFADAKALLAEPRAAAAALAMTCSLYRSSFGSCSLAPRWARVWRWLRCRGGRTREARVKSKRRRRWPLRIAAVLAVFVVTATASKKTRLILSGC